MSAPVLVAALALAGAAWLTPSPPPSVPPALRPRTEDPRAEAVEDLLRGVEALGSPGIPGRALPLGPNAFVVVAGANRAPVVVAATDPADPQAEGGRVVALTHGGFLEPGILAQHDSARFLENAVAWCAGGKRRALVGAFSAGQRQLVEELGLRLAEDWREADVVLVGHGDVTPQRLGRLREFLAGGGGLVAAATSWGWQQLTSDQTLASDFLANRLLVERGVVFGDGTATDTLTDGFATRGAARLGGLTAPPGAELELNARWCLEALQRGGLSKAEADSARALLREALKVLDDHEAGLMLPARRLAEAGGSPLASELAGWFEPRELRPLTPRFSRWRLLGPLKAPKRGRDVLGELPPERELERRPLEGPDLGAEWKGIGGKLPWRPVELARGGRDLDLGDLDLEALLARELDPKEAAKGDWAQGAAAYLHRRIEVDQPASLNLGLEADGGLRVWLDGRPLGHAEATGDAVAARPSIAAPVTLEPGTHHLVVKVVHEVGPWRFRLRGEQGLDPLLVNAAIDRGVAYLIEDQYCDGSWPSVANYQAGYTAFALYCLLESGLDEQHPAVARALAWVENQPADYVYSLSCVLLALAEVDHDAARRERIEEALGTLAGWRKSREVMGLYAYPTHPSSGYLPADLSNTLYAALAFYKQHKVGLDVDPQVWLDIVDGTLRCFRDESGASAGSALGFAYRPGGAPTGSMTTAGVSVLVMAREVLGDDLPRRVRRDVDRAIDAGLAWLALNMTWEKNPGPGSPGHHYFFLYGVERVGALLGIEVLGGVPWYESGAEWLLRHQKDDGSWASNHGASVDTILALLFLSRATAPTSGRTAGGDWRAFSAAGGVEIAGVAGDPSDLWVQGLGAAARAAHGPDAQLERVTWHVAEGGPERVFATVTEGGQAGRFAARLPLERTGEVEVWAEAVLRVPPADPAGEPARVELASERVKVPRVYAKGDLDYALDHGRNVLARPGTRFGASSSQGGCTPADAADRKHDTNWIAEAEDAERSWWAEPDRAMDADRLLVAHRGPRPEHAGLSRVTCVRVVVTTAAGDRRTFEQDLLGDYMLKTEVPFGERLAVRRVEVTILGQTGAANTGFSELQLVLGD